MSEVEEDDVTPPATDATDEEDSDDENETVPRRSARLAGVHRDYVMHANALFVKVFFCSDGTIRVPKKYEDVMKSAQAKEWLAAILIN